MVKKDVKKRGRLCHSRIIADNSRSCNFGISDIRRTTKRFKTDSQGSSEKHKGCFSIRALISCNKGSAGSVEFILLLPLILFIIFGSIDYYITQMQYNHLENIKNYYTNIMKVQGTLTDEDLSALRTELDKSGFESTEINTGIDIVDCSGTDIRGRIVYRNIERPEEARMSLRIKTQPKMEPFLFGKLLGEKGEGKFFFFVKGDVLSEKSYYDEGTNN